MNKAQLRYILHKQTTVQFTYVYFRVLESLHFASFEPVSCIPPQQPSTGYITNRKSNYLKSPGTTVFSTVLPLLSTKVLLVVLWIRIRNFLAR